MALNRSKFNYVQLLQNDVSSEMGNKINVKPVDKHLDEEIDGIEQAFSILSQVILIQTYRWENMEGYLCTDIHFFFGST